MNRKTNSLLCIIFCLGISLICNAQLPQNEAPTTSNKLLKEKIDVLAEKIEPKVIEWRRHFHQNPELSN